MEKLSTCKGFVYFIINTSGSFQTPTRLLGSKAVGPEITFAFYLLSYSNDFSKWCFSVLKAS